MKSKSLRRLWLFLLLVAVLAFGAVWLVGGKLIAPQNRDIGDPPNNSFQRVDIARSGTKQITGWYVPAAEPSEVPATILLLHPVRSDRRAMLGRAQLLHNAGYGVLLIDLQAHGENEGPYISFGHAERLDVMAAVDWARATNPDHQVGVVGWSLGGAAAMLASPLELDALVLECVYPTIDEAVDNRVRKRVGHLHNAVSPLLLLQLGPRLGLSRSDLSPIDRAKKIKCPVLLMCGSHDEHTTLSESKRLYESFETAKQMVVFQGAKHEDLHRRDPEIYSISLLSFLKSSLTK